MAAVPFNPIPRISPAVTYRFRFHISCHAVERYRERATGDLSQLTQLELASFMDSLIFDAIAANRVRDVIDKDAPFQDTKVVEVSPKKGEKLHIVMRMRRPEQRMFTAGGPDCAALAAITSLTDEMAKEAYTDGRWFVKDNVKTDAPPPEDDGAPYEREKEDDEVSGLGGTRKERTDFIRDCLKINPVASHPVISDLAKKKFGVGISFVLFRKVRDEIAMELKQTPTPPKPEPTGVLAAMKESSWPRKTPEPSMHGSRGWEKQTEQATPPPPPAPPPAPAPAATVSSTVAQIAQQYALAVEQERMAKARVAEGERELAAAKESLTAAAAQVTMLLAQLAGQRAS